MLSWLSKLSGLVNKFVLAITEAVEAVEYKWAEHWRVWFVCAFAVIVYSACIIGALFALSGCNYADDYSMRGVARGGLFVVALISLGSSLFIVLSRYLGAFFAHLSSTLTVVEIVALLLMLTRCSTAGGGSSRDVAGICMGIAILLLVQTSTTWQRVSISGLMVAAIIAGTVALMSGCKRELPPITRENQMQRTAQERIAVMPCAPKPNYKDVTLVDCRLQTSDDGIQLQVCQYQMMGYDCAGILLVYMATSTGVCDRWTPIFRRCAGTEIEPAKPDTTETL